MDTKQFGIIMILAERMGEAMFLWLQLFSWAEKGKAGLMTRLSDTTSPLGGGQVDHSNKACADSRRYNSDLHSLETADVIWKGCGVRSTVALLIHCIAIAQQKLHIAVQARAGTFLTC